MQRDRCATAKHRIGLSEEVCTVSAEYPRDDGLFSFPCIGGVQSEFPVLGVNDLVFSHRVLLVPQRSFLGTFSRPYHIVKDTHARGICSPRFSHSDRCI